MIIPGFRYTPSRLLLLLSSEAHSLLEQARKYRQEMEALPQNDPRRPVYERLILGLLERSRKLSVTVTTSASST